jgi:hypothetical protein
VRFRHVIGACTLALLSTSCSLGDSADASSINVYVEVDKSTLGIGELVTITLIARNVGFEPLSLTGPSDCLMYVQVVTNQGEVVWNSNGACSGSTVTEEIAPGADKVQTITWDGTNLAGARLGAGFYHIRPVALVTGAAYVGPSVSIALE